ncbi:MAG: hydroxymethylbilane synthase [Lysinibacillus fusiformis]|uniref:hydroxymethylbilane synthase n=1 Tax=Lysinibacillus TaxID=400634 RepID=UPI0004DA3FD9|nr:MULTISPECIES: hydroxymethylbilane synthase [Lysinibacillus]KAB0443332.1 hydroxymethylbilane synthase [Lysinibacillus fusiformis]KEK12822.1 porphobilinogen deaminase [Lysinibacillus sphaericus]MCE4044748.1 hydroxymethylbilane synthase [Lysinibacillus fusiformis]MCT6926676.1 hydroxymethylbilane synthase [Lysinibacillus fusiformis]MCT6931013.1 hydroxymethylbilane synthase [Lysinibacillus fusiformis]
MRKIIVGSRRSKLALTQTNWFINELKAAGAPFEFEVKEIVTKGDQILDVQLSKVGGKGLFVKEIEQALYDKEIDFAVHSMKDMPAVLPEGLVIGCIPPREDARDAFISKGHVKFADLPAGAVVGTSSLRRSAQLLTVRPDLEIKWIRGNVDTRLAKLETEEYDAIILAAAGLKRLGWSEDVVTEFLSVEDCLPAVAQGSLGIECRGDDTELLAELAKLTDQLTWQEAHAERAFLAAMDGGCQVPIAGYATSNGDEITLTGLVAAPDASVVYKETVVGSDAKKIGEELATILTKQGAFDLIQRVKAEQDAK